MVSTRKIKQQNKRLFSHLSEFNTGFMIGQSNHRIRTESQVKTADKGISLDDINNNTQANYPEVDMHTLEENIGSKVRIEVDGVMTTVETKVQDAVLTAIESLVILRVELGMKSINASSRQSQDGNVLEADQRDFS